MAEQAVFYRGGTPVLATRDYDAEVAQRYDLDPDTAAMVAHICAQEIERVGRSDARPVFTPDGQGPVCSWCWAWPHLCRHLDYSEALSADDAEDVRWRSRIAADAAATPEEVS